MYKKQIYNNKNNISQKKWRNLFILLFVALVIIPKSFSKYTSIISETLILTVSKPEYYINYKRNGLPIGYQEVEYIENTGEQYIDTGVTPTNTLKTEIIYMDTSANGENYVLGSRTDDDLDIHYGLSGKANNLSIGPYYNSVTENSFTKTRVENQKYHVILEIENDIEQGYRMHSILNDLTENTTEEIYSEYHEEGLVGSFPNLFVFAIKNGNIHNGMRLYSLKFWEEDILISNFIPCYRISDGEIGLYDTENDVFYTNTGTGVFNKGDDVGVDGNVSIAGTMSNQHFIYGIPENLSTNTFVKEGYTFTGWNTMPDGSGTSYNDEQEVLNLTSKDGNLISLYAQWEEN